MRKTAERIFRAGVERVLPDTLIQSVLRYEEGQLVIANQSVYPFRRLYLLAAGKAAALMAQAAEEILGDVIAGGHVVTKYGHGLPLKRLTVTEAGHPLPDAAGIEAARRMLVIAQQAEEGDVLLCLFSGGASALMADLPEGATLDELIVANDLLVKSGAAISEINCLRKHLSCIKGGQLAAAAAPATVVSLILSDVVGDDLGVIASGPTAPDERTFADALAVIEAYGLSNRFPASLLTHLHNGVLGLLPETPKPGSAGFSNVHNHIIGNNRLALEGAAQQAEELGFEARIMTDSLQGDSCDAAEWILQTIRSYAGNKHEKPLCLLFGGETTLRVTGNGLGGRNQHLALRLAISLATSLERGNEVTILCAGTDGTDGPTDAAGAVVDTRTLSEARVLQLDAADYLSRFDAYRFFEQAGGHLITGNTRTNVMDVVVVLVSTLKTQAERLIELLQLEPLTVEGGFYRETYRSSEGIEKTALPHRYPGARSYSTAIYYLLTPEACSTLHRLPSDEVFHFYQGDPVEMLQLNEDGTGVVLSLGCDIENGLLPQVVVPKGTWQGARLKEGGAYALFGTTVAPGFEFEDHEVGDRSALIEAYPAFKEMIERLT